MNTTVETSRTSQSLTTSRPRVSLATVGLGDAPTPSVSGQMDNLASTFTLSEPTIQNIPSFLPAGGGNGALRFSQLAPEERQAAKSTLKELSQDARIWVRDNNSLRRADPAEVKERLDHGQPIEIVTRMGGEVRESSSNSYASDYKQRGFFTGAHNNTSSSNSASRSERVTYATSPITSWDSLDFVDTDGRGVPGTPSLPASGGSVNISNTFEQNWQTHSEAQWGFFTQKETVENQSGSTRVRQEL